MLLISLKRITGLVDSNDQEHEVNDELAGITYKIKTT